MTIDWVVALLVVLLLLLTQWQLFGLLGFVRRRMNQIEAKQAAQANLITGAFEAFAKAVDGATVDDEPAAPEVADPEPDEPDLVVSITINEEGFRIHSRMDLKNLISAMRAFGYRVTGPATTADGQHLH